MVYIGFPSKDVIINDKNDFIYLLCMFVALELITFSYFKEKYLMVKNIFDEKHNIDLKVDEIMGFAIQDTDICNGLFGGYFKLMMERKMNIGN
ncbi:MAG: hypothetical protein IPL31_17790 [Saprospiraceae bacterium]|nr:hypothetical protein [Saprospiraceae bacterium]